MKYDEVLDIVRTGEGYTINAQIHKDYNINSPVQINISPDRVEIVNPGKLLFPQEELGKRSVLRNPILVDLAHRLGLVEKAGSGIKRIQRLARMDDVNVEFKTGTFFDVRFHRTAGRKSDAKDRREWILTYLKSNRTITNKQVRNEFNIHRDTAIQDLSHLISQGKIVKKGGGRNVWYELKEDEA